MQQKCLKPPSQAGRGALSYLPGLFCFISEADFWNGMTQPQNERWFSVWSFPVHPQPFLPFGEWCQRAPKAKDDLSVNCQLLPHHFKYKIKPQILKGPSLFICINVWLTTKMVKGSIKFHSKPSSILAHQTALTTLL